MSKILEQISRTFKINSQNLSYEINGTRLTYNDFEQRIIAIKNNLLDSKLKDEFFIGIDASEISSFETYCQIFACIFAGKCFVPINLTYPEERIKYLIENTGINYVLIHTKSPLGIVNSQKSKFVNFINTTGILPQSDDKLEFKNLPDDEFAYILFTSGSTGFPKGVPITRGNLFGFAENFLEIGYAINSTDRFIQMFDFTFDLSIFSYFIPAIYGASVHPINSKGIKLANTFSIMVDNNVTVALLVPSVLSFLKPYYHEINLPQLKHLFFCGEAMSNDLTNLFLQCVPNARIVNFYGPTEATIFCIYYEWEKEKMDYKHHNGAVSIGKSFRNMYGIVLNEKNEEAKIGEVGELFLAGNQLTPGYFKNEEKNKTTFIELNYNNELLRLYRTGDLVFYDNDRDIMFCGRKDFQVKIQGFRVELGEIEHQIKKTINNDDVIVVAITNSGGNSELHTFIKGQADDIDRIKSRLPEILPSYMFPTGYHLVESFPLNSNGKIDRNKLKEKVQEIK